jgi:hypothetical protein
VLRCNPKELRRVGISPDQRRYLLVAHGAGAFVINFALNGAIGILAFRGVDPVPAWAAASAAGPDLVGTCLFLPAITCLIVTGIVRRHARSGQVTPLTGPLPRLLAPFRRPLASRALLFGVAGLALVGGPLALGLLSLGPETIALSPFLWSKAAFSALLAGLVTPLIGLVALADPASA